MGLWATKSHLSIRREKLACTREINILDPQAWGSRIMRETWQVYIFIWLGFWATATAKGTNNGQHCNHSEVLHLFSGVLVFHKSQPLFCKEADARIVQVCTRSVCPIMRNSVAVEACNTLLVFLCSGYYCLPVRNTAVKRKNPTPLPVFVASNPARIWEENLRDFCRKMS